MEQEINIAAILRDKLKGTKLYDIQKGIEVEYCCIETIKSTGKAIIWCNHQKRDRTLKLGYSESGKERGWEDGMQILKPSKDMQDWSKLAWKKGDVLFDNKGFTCLFYKWKDDTYTSFIGKYTHFEDLHNCSVKLFTDDFCKIISDEKIDDVIKEVETYYNGKLNLETLEIEKSDPQFKDGDIVVREEDLAKSYAKCILIFKTVRDIDNRVECYAFYNDYDKSVNLGNTLYNGELRLATDSEKQQLFDVLAKDGKRWNSETKTLEDLSKKCEFKPMDWCLMRDFGENWKLCQFGFKEEEPATDQAPYNAIGGNWFNQCIPYNDQTAHLLGTTDDYEEIN